MIFVLLPLEAILWYPELQKGYAGLIVLAIVGVAIAFLLIWLIIALLIELRPQFSLRTLLIFVTLFACVCSGFAVLRDMAKRQKEAVESLRKLGGEVLYDSQYERERQFDPRGPDGNDYSDEIASVSIWNHNANNDDLQALKELRCLRVLKLEHTRITDDGLRYLQGMRYLEELCLRDTPITDVGLEKLEGLKHLQYLDLTGTQITDAGVAKLQEALPNCHIYH